MRGSQDSRAEELRLALSQRTALREFWMSTKQTLKPIAESVKALLLPYQLGENALRAQTQNQELILLLDKDLPPQMVAEFEVRYRMRRVKTALLYLCEEVYRLRSNEAEVQPIEDLCDVTITETIASVGDLEADCHIRLLEIDLTIQRVKKAISLSKLPTAMLLFTPMSKPTRKNRFIV